MKLSRPVNLFNYLSMDNLNLYRNFEYYHPLSEYIPRHVRPIPSMVKPDFISSSPSRDVTITATPIATGTLSK